METIFRDGYTIHVDVERTRRDCRDRPLCPICLSGLLPELTAFLDSLGIDINRPVQYAPDASDLVYRAYGFFSSPTGYELDFYGDGKWASCALYAETGRFSVEVFGLALS